MLANGVAYVDASPTLAELGPFVNRNTNQHIGRSPSLLKESGSQTNHYEVFQLFLNFKTHVNKFLTFMTALKVYNNIDLFIARL